MQDQEARRCGVVQLRPGQLDLLQLAQNLTLEVADSNPVAGAGRVHSELAVHLPPGDPLRIAEREGPVDQPQVEIEAQRRTLEGRFVQAVSPVIPFCVLEF